MSKKWYVLLGRGTTLNKTLVKDVFPSNGKYFIIDVYGGTYVVNKKNFEIAKKEIN